MASLVEDKKRRHDDVSRLLRRVRIPPVEQTGVDDGVRITQVQLKFKKRTDRMRKHQSAGNAHKHRYLLGKVTNNYGSC